MKNRIKKILTALLFLFIFIQFIRPTRNVSNLNGPNEIEKKYTVPANVQSILKQSCYDCHSNNTNYPWYANIQPIGWWIQYWHVNDGKHQLNFSEFAAYPEKKAKKKFDAIGDEVTEGEMPLTTYTIMHSEARLSAEQSKVLIDWAEALK